MLFVLAQRLPTTFTWTAPLLATCTSYTLLTAYCYPQEQAQVIEHARALYATSPTTLVIGATDTGYLSYFSRHEVVNLDGLVNERAFRAIEAGRFSTYLASRHFDHVIVESWRWGYYDRALPADQSYARYSNR